MKIKVAEIFESISGEIGGFPQGSPCTFVRLAGCSLRCPFCDTPQFQDPESGKDWELEDLVKEIFSFSWKQVLITGGEPMEQGAGVQAIVNQIKGSRDEYKIQVETNGSIPINKTFLVDHWVVDCKGKDAMGGVPYEFQFHPDVFQKNIWIKYLVGSQRDLARAIHLAWSLNVGAWNRPKFAISPLKGKVESSEVVSAILRSGLPIMLNAQIHKQIGVR